MEIEVQRIEQLNEPKFIDYTELKIKKVNKERKIVGNTTFHVDLDNDVIGVVYLFQKQGGEYRLMPYKLQNKGICDFFNDDNIFYPEYSAVSDFALPFPCPFKAGRYEIRGYAPTLKNMPTVMLTTGEYGAEVTYSKGELEYLKIRVYVAIINI